MCWYCTGQVFSARIKEEEGTGGERGFKRCEPLTVRDQVSRFVLAMHI
jgi:hypothetical protein